MRRERIIGLGMLLLGVGTAASSLLGPLALGVIHWRVSRGAESQLIGGDLVGLALVAPVCLAAAALWWRGQRLAPAVALGPCLYGLYTYPVAILLPEYERYPGNNERAFPLYLALTLLSWSLAATAWSALDGDRLPELSRRQRWTLAAPLLLVGALLTLAWSAQIAPVMRGDTSLSAYRDEPTGFWLVRTLDLGFVVPLALATAVGLLRRRPLATKVVYAVVGFQTLLAAAVGGMGIAQLVRDDPNATVAFPAVVLVVALTLGALTLRLYQLYAADGGADRVDAETRRAHRDTAPRLRVIRHN